MSLLKPGLVLTTLSSAYTLPHLPLFCQANSCSYPGPWDLPHDAFFQNPATTFSMHLPPRFLSCFEPLTELRFPHQLSSVCLFSSLSITRFTLGVCCWNGKETLIKIKFRSCHLAARHGCHPFLLQFFTVESGDHLPVPSPGVAVINQALVPEGHLQPDLELVLSPRGMKTGHGDTGHDT